MPANELLQVLRARPFLPFRLHTVDGMVYEVRHPDFVIVTPGAAFVGYPNPDQPGGAIRVDIVALRAVTRIEFIEQPQQA
jgi:hypothetical protein